MDFTALTGCCAWSDDDGLGLRMSRWYEQRAEAKILCVSWKISVARKCGTPLFKTAEAENSEHCTALDMV